MWWGGFSEGLERNNLLKKDSFNPHVVGRFFRDRLASVIASHKVVLIPMWWGGFSESGGVFSLLNSNA